MSESFKERLFPYLPQIIKKFDSPFHIYDRRGIMETLRKMKEAFSSQDITFKEFFAVKALPKPAIMEIIKEEDCGFDCSSIPELRLARNAGAEPEDIMFTSNNTDADELFEAKKDGGCILNLDDEIFIDKIYGTFPELVCFRLNPGNRKTGDEVNSIIGDPLNSKYGVPIEKIVEVYKRAKAKGAKRFGLHTMVCSNDLDYTHMVNTTRLLLETASSLMISGIELEFINIGGGIGIPYRPSDKPFDIEALAEECANELDDFSASNGYKPKLYMESGRYVTGPHGVLVNRVINVYEKYKSFVGVQVSMPALMRVGMYKDAYHHCTALDKNGVPKTGPTKKVTIAGSICENCDVLAKDIDLPLVEEGDLIITHDTGAHGSAMGFNYNGRTRPAELLLNLDNSVEMICREEYYRDLERRHQDLGRPLYLK